MQSILSDWGGHWNNICISNPKYWRGTCPQCPPPPPPPPQFLHLCLNIIFIVIMTHTYICRHLVINNRLDCELELRVLVIIVLDRRHWKKLYLNNNAPVNKHHDNKQTYCSYQEYELFGQLFRPQDNVILPLLASSISICFHIN